MRCWIVIPIKAPHLCKTRLSPALGDRERQAVVTAMLHQTVSAARAVVGRNQVLLLGPSRHDLAEDTPLLPDPGLGLNAALASARDAAAREEVERVLMLSADLPLIEPNDVAAMLNVPKDSIALGADRAGTGTNALSLPLPRAIQFRFRYGEGSFAAHEAEAARLGLPFLSLQRPGLELDIDRADDVALWRQG